MCIVLGLMPWNGKRKKKGAHCPEMMMLPGNDSEEKIIINMRETVTGRKKNFCVVIRGMKTLLNMVTKYACFYCPQFYLVLLYHIKVTDSSPHL
jgi:hypothetical protein